MIAIYIESELEKYKNEIRYTFDFVFNTIGYEFKFITRLDQLLNNDILFYYGLIVPSVKEAYILAMNKIIFFIPAEPSLLQPGKLKREQLKVSEIQLEEKIPVISEQEIEVPIQFYTDTDIFYGVYKFDLIGNIFFNLIGYDEIISLKKDKHDRVPDSELILINYRLIPFVNHLLWLIEKFIIDAVSKRDSYFLLKKEYWPQAESFAVAFSHNIDKLQKWTLSKIIKSTLEDFLVFYKIRYIINNFVSKMKFILTNIEEYWNFEIIDETENLYRVCSTFFFGTESEIPEDIDYEIKNNDVLKEVLNNLTKGNEIALLASYKSSRNDILSRQKKSITGITGTDKIGIRHIYKNFDTKITAEFHKKNGFAYDSSRGFIQNIGFKYGIAFPYHRFSFTKKAMNSFNNSKYLEIPPIFCDNALKISKMKILPFEKAKELIDNILEAFEKTNGLLTFNFSISNFTEIPYNKQLFSHILEEIIPGNVFIATFMEIADWWKQRESVEIKEKEDEISIYFPQKMDKCCFTLLGNYHIFTIVGAINKLKDNKIFLSDIKADTTVKIRLEKPEISDKTEQEKQ
ncbi:MAG: hypothetical protein K8R49_06790 [Candidatus Cloacimonetes bacterium]|nr:hypothetical protein [Candidatus Cloacimonadota bacterium]